MSKIIPENNIVKVEQINMPASPQLSSRKTYNVDVLATRNLVLFPGVITTINIGRRKSHEVIENAEKNQSLIAVICQKSPDTDDPVLSDLYDTGVVARVIKVLPLPDGQAAAFVTAIDKCKVVEDTSTPNRLSAKIKIIKDRMPRGEERMETLKNYAMAIKSLTLRLTSGDDGEIRPEMSMLEQNDDPVDIINIVATHFPAPADLKMNMLESNDLLFRADLLAIELHRHEQMIDLSNRLQKQAKESFDEQQKRAFLQRQMETIEQELNGGESETDILRERADKTPLPEKVKELFDREYNKLLRNNPQSPDYAVQYSYLETLLELPWGKYDVTDTTLDVAAESLDNDHYGLKKVKERIVEQVALLLNNPDGQSPIICLVGPPGVGKTSLGKSIAYALGRKFERISLGGLHDEAEIRGHRRTYIGAMPGRVMQAIKRSGVSNPVLMLDEIDKIGKDYKGDPEAAMLEVLDPEQNVRFHDNYIDVDFDLSKVMFIATANSVAELSRPLLDRMEVIDLSGYVVEEKIEIARRHLIPAALKQLALDNKDFNITDEGLIRIIEKYTAESGVRQLDKAIKSLIRKVIVCKLSDRPYPNPITGDDLETMLGIPRYNPEHCLAKPYPGVVTGLAWTAAGGEILFIETAISKSGDKNLTLTGNLGNVMKESAIIALEYICSHALELGLTDQMLTDAKFHIHVPEGAIPKDGPSAGITMATSILSALRKAEIPTNIAMTGELTLRGQVLPVGGIKEKVLAARRAGITDIILCEDNRKDVVEIDERYRKSLKFHFVTDIRQVFDITMP